MMSPYTETLNYKSLLADALQEMRNLRSQVEAGEKAKTEPIAIIGMDCRFPGGANNPELYWQLLRNGIDGISEIPSDRWEVEQYYDPDPTQPGKMYTRYGGFLDQIDQFDPRFFGISPLEAMSMDPQQRLLLEVSYCALEQVGYTLEELKGSKTGVFVGICFDDYAKVSLQGRNLEKIEAFTSLGNSKSIAVGRLSYAFGFQGPALSLDTSCSSSLLAIHLACQSLRHRESDLALAGGVNLMLAPDVTIGFCKLRALSPSGRCRTFDAKADGYARGEGCGIVVLKRLSDAIASGDPIMAVIRGSAANHDGRSNGLTAPNGLAQEEVIRQALSNAKLQPDEIQYIEAHGTGTTLGDPIEVLALGKVFGQGRTPENPLFLGAVKSNIGHLEGAAGVAALLKVVLALQHQQIPRQLHFEDSNPYIPWQQLPMTIPTELTSWSFKEQVRRAGVSAFGMSGTNVHLIVEEAPARVTTDPCTTPQLLVFSAKTPTALDQMAVNLAQYLQQHPQINLADVAYTLSRGRSAYPYRRILVSSHLEETVESLHNFNQQAFNYVPETQQSSVVFLFPGQGSQSVNMGRQLYQNEAIFRQVIDECAEFLHPHLGLDLRSLLYPTTPSTTTAEQLQQTAMTQVILFVFEYALAKLWLSWGIRPTAMLGHSLGEYVAACLSGVFSLKDALLLVTWRGQLMQKMPAGKMLAVALSEKQVLALITSDNIGQESLSLAVINSPSQCVVSGTHEAIESFRGQCLEQGIICRLLNTSHAFHSYMMEPILQKFIQQVQKISLHPPQIPYLSNVTGTWITTEQACNPVYWAKHLRQTVRFADGLQELFNNPDYILLEVGPGQTLSKLVKQQQESNLTCLASFPYPERQDSQNSDSLLMTLGKLWLAGIKADWSGFYAGQSHHLLPLPSYPFDRQRYWFNASDVDQSSKNHLELLQTRPKIQTPYVAPRNKMEQYLSEILEEYLGTRPIGIDDHFFDLGGDSLLAIEIVSRLSQTLQVQLNQSQLLETPTIAMLALMLEKNTLADTSPRSIVQIQAGGSKPPLFFIHPAGGTVYCYQKFIPYLDLEQPIYGLEDPAIHQVNPFENFQQKAQYYVEQIRQIQPKGPYFLAGYSYGGNMALEIAIQLKKQEADVKFLAMLDSFPPVAYKNIAIDDTRLLAAIWQMSALIFEKKSRCWYEDLKKVEPQRQIEYVLEQLLEDNQGIIIPKAVLEEKTLQVAMNNFRELHHYTPSEIYVGQITYFWAHEKIPESLSILLNYQIPDDLIAEGWSQFSTQPIKTCYVPGHHFTMLNENNFSVLSERFLTLLNEQISS